MLTAPDDVLMVLFSKMEGEQLRVLVRLASCVEVEIRDPLFSRVKAGTRYSEHAAALTAIFPRWLLDIGL